MFVNEYLTPSVVFVGVFRAVDGGVGAGAVGVVDVGMVGGVVVVVVYKVRFFIQKYNKIHDADVSKKMNFGVENRFWRNSR